MKEKLWAVLVRTKDGKAEWSSHGSKEHAESERGIYERNGHLVDAIVEYEETEAYPRLLIHDGNVEVADIYSIQDLGRLECLSADTVVGGIAGAEMTLRELRQVKEWAEGALRYLAGHGQG